MNKVNYQHLSPVCFLERSAKVYGDKIALISKDNKKTYGEFFLECEKLAHAFKHLGLRASSKVAYLSRNNFELLEAHYAVPMFGGVLVPINVMLNPEEVCYILKHSDSEVLVVEDIFFDESYFKFISKIIIIRRLNTSNTSKCFCYYDKFIELSDSTYDLEPLELSNENLPITINYTSGTTGTPKGVVYSHRSTYLNSLGECLTANLTKESRFLWVLPMFHCNGWCYTWAITAVGGTHVFIETLHPSENIIDQIIQYKITHLCAAPTVLIMLLEAKNFLLLKAMKDLIIITAGSAPSSTLIQNYANVGISIMHVYGLTETHGPHLMCEENISWIKSPPKDRIKMKSRQGVPSLHGVYARVVDQKFTDVPHDGTTIGEIVLRGNNIMREYYKDPETTKHSFRNGWFHTGDLAVVHTDGYIEVKDRNKDIIISGGEKISSIEVESIIYQLPGVCIVAVIAVPHAFWGEIPHAIIELKKGYELSAEQIISYCRSKLAHFKCPRAVTFASIPKTSTGKIQKHVLKIRYNKN